MFPFVLALLTMLAMAALVVPLLARGRMLSDRLGHDLAVYRDQLAEIERDRDRGVLDAGQAAAARLEVERRMLAAARLDAQAKPPRAAAASPLIVGMVGALPLLALLFYLIHGSPQLPSAPFAGRDVEREAAQRTSEEMHRIVEELVRRTAQRPDDVQAWTLLGGAYVGLGRHDEAVRAYARAVALAQERADLLSAYGEALVLANKGTVTPQALESFKSALARQPDDVRANFYHGLADSQAGRQREAMARWLALEARAGADAPWLASLQAHIAQLARDSGIDPLSIRPDRKPVQPNAANRPGPSDDDIERMGKLDPAARQAQIRAMVDGLAEKLKQQPDDIEGWKRLAQAWLVLGESEKSMAAFEEATKRAPQDAALWRSYVDALTSIAGEQALGEPRMRAALEALLRLEPENPLALFYMGESEARAGNNGRARELWQKLLTKIPAEAPQRALIERRLQSLPQ